MHCIYFINFPRMGWLISGAYEGGGRAPHPPIRVPSLRGVLMGGSFNITSSSGNLHSTLHYIALTQTKRLRKKIKIYSDSQQYPSKLCLIKYCIKNPCFSFWKQNIIICGFSTKVTCAFLAPETMDKWRFLRYIGHATL